MIHFIIGGAEIFVPFTNEEPGDHHLPKLLLCSPKLADKQRLNF